VWEPGIVASKAETIYKDSPWCLLHLRRAFGGAEDLVRRLAEVHPTLIAAKNGSGFTLSATGGVERREEVEELFEEPPLDNEPEEVDFRRRIEELEARNNVLEAQLAFVKEADACEDWDDL
jgi:hypothetical protein